jgi:hypothetical protein
MITCPCCNARLDAELPPDREQANNLVPEPAQPAESGSLRSDLVGAEIELRTESDETVVASCALPISINALCAMEKGLSAQYGAGLYMRQRGKMLEFFKPSRAQKKVPTAAGEPRPPENLKG